MLVDGVDERPRLAALVLMAGRLSRNREAMAAPLRLRLERQKQRTMCWLTAARSAGL